MPSLLLDLVVICTRKCTQELFDVCHKLRTNRKKTSYLSRRQKEKIYNNSHIGTLHTTSHPTWMLYGEHPKLDCWGKQTANRPGILLPKSKEVCNLSQATTKLRRQFVLRQC